MEIFWKGIWEYFSTVLGRNYHCGRVEMPPITVIVPYWEVWPQGLIISRDAGVFNHVTKFLSHIHESIKLWLDILDFFIEAFCMVAVLNFFMGDILTEYSQLCVQAPVNDRKQDLEVLKYIDN